MAAVCNGQGTDHCCYIGGVCPHLEEGTVPGRRWACGLRRELGSWDRVHVDARYQIVRDRLGDDFQCGDYPQRDITCGACGLTGG